jgi:lipase ATG15
VTLIAIRGTDVGRLQDLMENVKLYAEPVIFAILSNVFPSIRHWPSSTTSAVIQGLYDLNSFFGLQGEAEYYRPLVRRVLQLTAAGRQVALTGHSLGGGLARIVGSLTGQPSVSFNPPGLALSHAKYSLRSPEMPGGYLRLSNAEGALHHQSVAVITEFDIIPSLDQQVGLVQRILCDDHAKSHHNACHLLEGQICHLLEHCGDSRGRFVGCTADIDMAAVLPTLRSFLVRHRYIALPLMLLSPLLLALAVVPEIL